MSVRFRHSLRECSDVVKEAGASGDDTSGQLTRGTHDQDPQLTSLPRELAKFVTDTKVDSLTHKAIVSKEKLRKRFSQYIFKSRCFKTKFLFFSQDLRQHFGTGFNLTSLDMSRRQFSSTVRLLTR